MRTTTPIRIMDTEADTCRPKISLRVRTWDISRTTSRNTNLRTSLLINHITSSSNMDTAVITYLHTAALDIATDPSGPAYTDHMATMDTVLLRAITFRT